MMFGNQNSIFQSAFPQQGIVEGERPSPLGGFAWGAGGSRLTPDQLALRQKQALADQQVDTSPVGHWTQGLARVANNLAGAFEQRSVDKESQAIEEGRAQSIAALLAPQAAATADQGSGAVAQGLLSYDPTVQKLAMAQYEASHPKPRAPSAFEELGALAGLTPEQIKAGAGQKFNNDIDPLVNFVVGGNTVVGPRSQVSQQFGGSQPAATPPAPAIERLRANPSEAVQFDQVFGPGAAQRALGGM